MRRHYFRWFQAAIILVVAVIAATTWAKTGHDSETVNCPGVDSGGNLTAVGEAHPLMIVTFNEKNGAYHGTVQATVANNSGHNLTFIDSGFNFGLINVTKSKYVVKANGAATLTVHGVFPH